MYHCALCENMCYNNKNDNDKNKNYNNKNNDNNICNCYCMHWLTTTEVAWATANIIKEWKYRDIVSANSIASMVSNLLVKKTMTVKESK